MKSSNLVTILFNFIAIGVMFPGPADADLSVDHAYLRRPVPQCDPGTIHLFLSNEGNKPELIKRVYVNDIALPKIVQSEAESLISDSQGGSHDWAVKRLPDRDFVWFRILPNPVPEHGVSDVAIKLARPTKKPIKIEVESLNGQRLRRVIRSITSPLVVTFVGFSRAYDKLYVYLENRSGVTLTPTKIFLDTQDVTAISSMPWKAIPPKEKRCVVVRLGRPLQQGKYIAVKVETLENDLIKAENLVRVFSLFPITSWDGDSREEFFFDLRPLFFQDEKSSGKRNVKGELYRVMTDPNAKDRDAGGRIGLNAQRIIGLAQKFYSRSPLTPTFVNIDEYRKPFSYFVYGEVADTAGVNPYEMQFYREQPKRNGYFIRLAKLATQPRPLYAIPEAFKTRWVYHARRLPTPEEERLIVYYEISRGAKGIIYFHRGVGDKYCQGYESDQQLKNEIARINGELQILKRFLAVGDPVKLARCNHPDVEPNTILCGYDAIVLILINDDHNSDFTEAGDTFSFKPKKNFEVTVGIPPRMHIKDVYEVGGSYTRMNFVEDGSDIRIPIDTLLLTKQIILTASKDDYGWDQDMDGISDIEEVKIFGSHPCSTLMKEYGE